MNTVQEVPKIALRLSPSEQQLLAHMLLAEGSTVPLANEGAWLREEKAGYDAYLRGEIQSISPEESKRRLGRL